MSPGSGRVEVLNISAVHSDSLVWLSWELGLLSSGGILDATAIRLSCTQ